jgi:hypothetical protein
MWLSCFLPRCWDLIICMHEAQYILSHYRFDSYVGSPSKAYTYIYPYGKGNHYFAIRAKYLTYGFLLKTPHT